MILNVDNVTKTYHGRAEKVQALNNISLALEPGEFVAIQGPSGCGKSTLLLAAGGLLAPDSGTVTVADENPYSMTPDARSAFRARTIGFVFQQFHLVPYLSILDNVLAPSIATGVTEGVQSRARELISRYGLEHRLAHVPGELSSGERQRTALARALLNEPRLLLADEPTGNLDEENSARVLDHLREFASSGGTVLLATHDAQAADRADRIVILRHGGVVAE